MSRCLTVHLQIQPGKAAEFEAAAGPAMARVRAEDKGCELYELFRNVNDDTRFAIIESWATQEDLDAHGKSPGMGEMAKIGPFLAGAPAIHRYEA